MIRAMGMTASDLGLVTATFLASTVELVEAFTIVLAMGLTRGWRSTLWGVAAALGALTVATAIAGYALATWFPASALQLAIGTLLLIFGLQWLRKAILRSAGLKALHDEEEIFLAEQPVLRKPAFQEFCNRRLRRQVGFGHQIRPALFTNGEF